MKVDRFFEGGIDFFSDSTFFIVALRLQNRIVEINMEYCYSFLWEFTSSLSVKLQDNSFSLLRKKMQHPVRTSGYTHRTANQ